ncbi:growth-regulating factor 1-like isoform X2 [Curcuma longa]|uniref:growth-regulating factor 1-like isoform X2 n=1 Tax=Curcuma longa TaxID=136217 RepID=UPI003D9EA7C7
MMMTGGGSCRHPFTLSQWQELELQALIFKYMASAVPVPPDLVYCVRRSLFAEPRPPRFLPHPPAIGWGAYQMGDGRKEADPEPGRCRRTDGKKWRCSKEAFPDSKYCERHIHRGKGRSRKPVELSLATGRPAVSHSSPNFHPPPPLAFSSPRTDHHLLFPCSSYVRPSAMGSGYSHCEDSSNFCLQSLPHSLDKHRNILGFKEGAHEFPFLPEGCRTGRELRCSFGPMEMNSKHTYSSMQSIDSHFRMRASKDEEDEQHCLLGADLKMEMAANGGLEKDEEQPRPFHCFLDEKPPKVDGSWISMDVGLKTQLSMSIPLANHDVPVTASQCYNG